MRVAAYDMLGRRVALLFESAAMAGQTRALVFEASRMPDGLYLIRAEGEYFTATRCVLLRK